MTFQAGPWADTEETEVPTWNLAVQRETPVEPQWIELPDWAVVALGAVFAGMAGMICGAWLHI